MTESEEGQRVLDIANGRARTMTAAESKRRKEREEINRAIDKATSLISGKSIAEVRKERIEREEKRREQTKEIYEIILSNEFNDVSLQKINDYLNDVTPNNPYGRRLSERLPQRVERKLYERARENAVDALFSRASESAVAPNGRTREEGRREVEERKKKALEAWAKATGNWHTELTDFTDDTEPIGHGTDSDVYLSKDGSHVVKMSHGKPEGKRFRPDIDNIPLFNYVFPNSAYRILGYGDFGKGFVRILEQPYVDFSTSTPLTERERVEYMEGLGFKSINDANTAFSNGEIVVADLQKSNIVRDAAGNISVLDADCKLHTRDVGGTYEYLPVEHDLPLGGQVKFFRTESGEAYGFTMGGKIYLDPKIATAETPVHEYTHLWAAALRAANPKAWEQLKSELEKDKELVAYVRGLYPELAESNGANGANGLSDELAEEVFAHFSGRRGAERLREEQRKAMDEASDYVEKAGVVAMFERLRDALKKFWNMARDLFAGKTRGIKSMSAEDFADMVLGDLVNGVKPDSGDRLDRSDRERDAEYMEAVESGDMEKAQRMVNEAAKRAMPDTKVVDENGNPLVVYHGGKGKIIVFDKNRIGENLDYGTMGAGFYFTSDRENAENYARNAKREGEPSVERVFINIRNIKEVNWNELDGKSKKKSEAFTAKAIAKGYDGLTAYAPNRAWWYVVFDPNQIKSADPVTYDDNGNVLPLSQRFNKPNADIRYQRGGDVEAVKDNVLREFEAAKKGNAEGRRIPIGSLTKAGRDYLEKLSGITMKPNVDFILNASDLRHIYNDHYGENEKDKGNNIPLTDEDIRSMVDVITIPDKVVFGVEKDTNRRMFYFFKKNENGTYNLAEVYSDRHGNLTAKTYFNTKRTINQRVNDLDKSQTLTSVTGGASSFSDAKIPKLFDIAEKNVENSTDSDVRFRGEEEPVFYSNAMRAVENSKQERATPEQWVKMIEKNGGYRKSSPSRLGELFVFLVG